MKNRLNLLIDDAIAVSLTVTAPAWPLQNSVAVNPFWNLIGKKFTEVALDLAPVLHHSMFMPISYYLEKYQKGTIRPAVLEKILRRSQSIHRDIPTRLDLFVQHSTHVSGVGARYLTFAEFYDEQSKTSWRETIDNEVGKYASCYFDRQQALIKFPWQHQPFWQAWRSAQSYDQSLDRLDLTGFQTKVGKIQDGEALDYLVSNLQSLVKNHFSNLSFQDLQNLDQESPLYQQIKSGIVGYLSRLLIQSFGWASHFRWHSWQGDLSGRSETNESQHQLVDLLAVRLAYDQILSALKVDQESGELARDWTEHMFSVDQQGETFESGLEVQNIWLEALEQSLQERYGSMIRPLIPTQTIEQPLGEPRFDVCVVMCIDVRSELMRRHLEAVSDKIVTIGFAGFFGVPMAYRLKTDKDASHRLPVLLGPTLIVDGEQDTFNSPHSLNNVLFKGFFKNLRKAPLSSFLFVEIFGLFSLYYLAKSFWLSLFAKRIPRFIFRRFSSLGHLPSQKLVYNSKGTQLDLADKIHLANGILKKMGLTKDFAPLVVICGHGSLTTNNIFGSTLDCGACGGHAGDINARFLVDLLNDPLVRQGLLQSDCAIPDTTVFIPAIHETISDTIVLLDESLADKVQASCLETFKNNLKTACTNAQKERQTNRSLYLDHSPWRRMRNWSEVRPEWGLAGHALFIVAPRAMTRGAPLASRAFLHDYDWRQDDDFSTLELIMTAPMIVTHWINFQYYASTVIPEIYGAGNKLIHNLVNESGALEGVGGDLKVGLPLQSVFDGDKFVHDPVRLSVFIAAPREEIEKVIAKSQVVRDLVDKEWLHLIQISEADQKVTLARRQPGGHLWRNL